MEYKIEEREEPLQTVLFIGTTCKATEIGPTLGQLYGEIGRYIGQNGAKTVGPPFCRYTAMHGDTWDLEGGIAIAEPIPVSGRIQSGQLGGHVACTLHTGPYDRLGAAHEALGAWAEAQGKTIAGAPWDLYITDPGELPDPETWQTMVYLPIA